MTEQVIRCRVEKLVGKRLPDSLWRQLAVADGWLGTFQSNSALGQTPEEEIEDIRDLAQKAREYLPLIQPSNGPPDQQPLVPTERRQRRMKREDLRREKLSELIAAIARHRADVLQFQQEELGGNLLKPAQIERWIKRHVPAEGEVQRLVAVRVPPGTTISPPASVILFDTDVQVENPNAIPIDPPFEVSEAEHVVPADLLCYAKPGSPWVHRARVGGDGPLRSLFQLSRQLSRDCGWQEAQATVFVLTDLTPMLSPIRFGVTANYQMPALSKVAISLDLSVTPRELAEQYGRLRSKILGKRKPRSLGRKATELAVFATSRPHLDGRPLLDAWNAMYPRWAYRARGPGRHSLLHRFNRDLKRAQALLQGLPIPWQVLAELGEL